MFLKKHRRLLSETTITRLQSDTNSQVQANTTDTSVTAATLHEEQIQPNTTSTIKHQNNNANHNDNVFLMEQMLLVIETIVQITKTRLQKEFGYVRFATNP